MSVVAIDFGTSNTVVCTLDPISQTPQTLSFPGISRRFETATGSVAVVPTLALVQVNQVLIGEAVRAQRLGFAQPDRYFHSFKRDLVSVFQAPPRYIDDHPYSAAQISECFLQALWQQIQQQIQPTQVILTVPVGAFERYLDWFRSLAQKLALPNVRLVDESTAAALGYAVQRPGTLVLVIDFGGGTLDLSLVRTTALPEQETILRAEVLAKSDAYIGGIDVDIWIVEDYLRQLGTTREQIGPIGWQNLLEIAERLKIRLSYASEATESWFDDETFMAHDVNYSRSRLDDLLEAQQLLEQVRRALDDLLTTALNKGIHKSDIEQVLLVGGSCQIPAVQQLVISYFGRQRVRLDKPFEAVAQGALALSRLADVDDYLHHTYAIRLWEPYSQSYTYHPLFEKGRRYPCKRSEPLVLQVAIAGQSEIRLDIGEVAERFQAEVAYDDQGRMTSTHLNRQETFRSLDTAQEMICVAHLEPPGQLGVDRISVQFEVNAQRMLIATVRDLLTQQVLVDGEAIVRLR